MYSGSCLLAWIAALTLVVSARVDGSHSLAALHTKWQGYERIISAHRQAQRYVEMKLDLDPSLQDLLCSRPAYAGFVSKNSSVELSPTIRDQSGADLFKQERVPIYASCQVFVSDTWKFIYVRQPKASSSTMLHAIHTQLCGGRCSEPDFYQEFDATKLPAKWGSYFVFTVVRNPWTRALSAYSMFHRNILYRRPHPQFQDAPTRQCGLSFPTYANDVYSLRAICERGGCCSYLRHIPGWVPSFVDVHISDHGHCMHLPSGEPLVDYVGVSEAFDTAWATIVAEINRRAGTAFVPVHPDSRNGKVNAAGAAEHSCGAARAMAFYNATTARAVARQFALDIFRLGYL